jgi:uncharacterized protein (TIGR02246 family)
MADKANQSSDEKEIAVLIGTWSAAVRAQNRAAIEANHAADVLMFDVPPPLQSRGIKAYMATWDTFYSSAEKPVMFDFTEVAITAGSDVAFATAIGHCVTIDRAGRREPLEFRLTMGLRKVGRRWQIVHEHHSVPAV